MPRARQFYQHLLQVQLAEVQVGGILMAIFPTENPRYGGALCQGSWYVPHATAGPLVYLDCGPSLEETLARVEPAGGQVLFQRTFIGPQQGSIAAFLDSEGNRVGLHGTA